MHHPLRHRSISVTRPTREIAIGSTSAAPGLSRRFVTAHLLVAAAGPLWLYKRHTARAHSRSAQPSCPLAFAFLPSGPQCNLSCLAPPRDRMRLPLTPSRPKPPVSFSVVRLRARRRPSRQALSRACGAQKGGRASAPTHRASPCPLLDPPCCLRATTAAGRMGGQSSADRKGR